MSNNKKNIIIIMNNLRVGGAEKALISLLQTFNYSLYNVDLLLFKKEGLFLNQVPKEVKILDEPKEYKFFDMSFSKAILNALKLLRFDIVINRIAMGFLFKTEKNVAVREQKLWKFLGKCLPPISKKYDMAIGFLEKTPNYFCADKVTATVKIGFINNDYEKLEMNPKLDYNCFNKLNYIATVSDECLASLQRNFPNYLDKLLVIGNISTPKLILKLADETIKPLHSGLKLITLGRLAPQKGYDLLVEAAYILKQKNINFKWYILGIGELQNELNSQIAKYDLQSEIIFLGLKENPYPYIKQADFYIQPSRFEGKSLAIDEAKILKKPIIVTDFSTAKDQIISEVNGLIVAMNPEAIASAIIKLQSDLELQTKLIFNLSNEKMGNESEIEKIYTLIN